MADLLIMTFNVRGSHHRDGENAWERRAALNVATIKRYAPAIIGFQELQDGNLKAYEAAFPGYGYTLGPRYENRRPHAHNAIFWDRSRMELVRGGGYWLSKSPERFSKSWDARHVRSVNWALLRLLPDGGGFLHLNTHLDHVSGPARRKGAELIVRWLARTGLDTPVLLTGDFNCNPRSDTYNVFAGADFSDAHLLVGNGPANTFHKFEGDRHRQRTGREGRIDWILLRDGARRMWNVRSCEIVRDAELPVYPSDHYPVVARCTLEVTRSYPV
jgi:endonuclease/exonuclease/phosphatase family metal-dependent hydrolase